MAAFGEHQVIEETWDKKKIAIGIISFLVLGTSAFAAKQYFFPSASGGITHVQKTIGVQGAETSINGADTPTSESTNQGTFSLPSTQDVQNQIQHIQQQVTSLNIADIASSSPQVQQIIQQIEQLPSAPANAAKAACVQLCDRL